MQNTTKFHMLSDSIIADIQKGIYPTGAKLPSEASLCTLFSVSRQTVRHALSILESDGFIKTKKGSGSYVLNKYHQQKRSHLVAIVTTYITEYIFPDILKSIEKILNENNLRPMIFATKNRVEDERKILLDILSLQLDGLIVEGTKTSLPNPNIDLYNALYDTGLPIVFINGYYPLLAYTPHVVANDYAGGFLVTEYLISSGHEHIAGIFKSDDVQGHRRFSGYTSALNEHHLMIKDDQILWFNTENKSSLIPLHIKKVIQNCTALVCYNDEIAVLVLDVIRKEGIRVPEDLSIIGFDNSIYGDLSSPKITTCSLPARKIGSLAAEKIVSMINQTPQTSSVLSWNIIEKESVKKLK